MRSINRIMLLAALLIPVSVQGQVNATGSFTGQVTDASGAAIANAKVKVSNQEDGTAITRSTSADGFYTAPLLKPGTYSVEASAPGFGSAVRHGLALQIQQVVQQDFKLIPGALQQEMTVEGGAPLLNTESTEVGNVLTQQATEELPLNGRNFSQLALLVSGVTPGPVGGIRQSGGGNETRRAGAEITASGARGTFNLFMIDGLDDRDQSVGTLKVFPNLESIAEFKVQIGNSDAEFATGGAVVNVITRSGSNNLHGSAFEFLRNSDFDARQFFDAQKPPFQQNQFGFAVGGPIKRNKTFFFGDYQGLRIHSSSTSILSEPAANLRNGDFSSYPSKIYDPATYNAATNTRQQFPGNVIPVSRLDPVALNLLQIFAQPNLPGQTNNFRFNILSVQVQDQYDARVDHTFSATDSMFGRYTYGTYDLTYPQAVPVEKNGVLNPLAYSGSNRLNHAPSQQATLQEIHTFTPAVVNQLALGYTRFFLQVTPLDLGNNTSDKLGLSGSNTSYVASSLASISLSGYSGYSSTSVPEIIPQNTFQLSDTLSWTRGAHSMKFGFSAVHNAFGFFQLGNSSGSLAFSGNYTNNPASAAGTGAAFADFLLGLPGGSTKSSLPNGIPYLTYTEYGGYAQDQWRATTRLTINLGLRYDLFTPPVERYNRQSDFLPGSGTVAVAGQSGVSAGILNVRKNDFAPRVGLAYRLGEKTVVRSAYGLYFFNEQGTGGSARLFINYPFAQSYSVSCSATVPCLTTANGIPNTLSSANLPSVVYIPQRNPTATMQQWNLTVERQMTPSLVVRGAYVGSRGNHLSISLDENVAVPGAGAIPARRPYPQYATIASYEPIGISTYHALELSAEKRFSKGMSFLAAYTFSKAIDEGGGGNSASAESRVNVQDPRNVKTEYGLADFNFPQRFTLSAIYDLPFGKGRQYLANASRILDGVAGGWALTSIVTAQNGPPGTVTMATSTSNTGTAQYPNRVCDGNLSNSQRTIQHWYDTSCFVAPALYTFGNAGRNIVIAPGLVTWDLGAHKDFRITEGTGLTLRGEFFNVLNKANFGYPNTSIGSLAAGSITSVVTTGRQIQLALRLHW
ncbi:MAG: TonB-dependent hemoglobin/transferrin/lactoferrin receptor family protein [Bryobacterales bacterium]|nr:TonB-dependent hemoglobin/transferrin/lactoferrin receptor family protein [Bryobacterales bacterium]